MLYIETGLLDLETIAKRKRLNMKVRLNRDKSTDGNGSQILRVPVDNHNKRRHGGAWNKRPRTAREHRRSKPLMRERINKRFKSLWGKWRGKVGNPILATYWREKQNGHLGNHLSPWWNWRETGQHNLQDQIKGVQGELQEWPPGPQMQSLQRGPRNSTKAVFSFGHQGWPECNTSMKRTPRISLGSVMWSTQLGQVSTPRILRGQVVSHQCHTRVARPWVFVSCREYSPEFKMMSTSSTVGWERKQDVFYQM